MTAAFLILNTATQRFRTRPGLGRGWSPSLEVARFFPTREEAEAEIASVGPEGLQLVHVTLSEEPLDALFAPA